MLVRSHALLQTAALGILSLCVSSSPAIALENAVIIESKTVVAGADSVWVGVFLENSIHLAQVMLPFELRTISGGAFVRSRTRLADNPVGRVYNSGLSSEGQCWQPPWPNPTVLHLRAPEDFDPCSGPVSGTYRPETEVQSGWYESPDAHLLRADGSTCGSMAPGQDPASADSASFMFILDIGDSTGQFIIDTCCIMTTHLQFMDQGFNEFTPGFSPGVITVIPCACPCAADPVCDGSADVSDVAAVIDVAFRGVSEFSDSTCLVARTDVNADGYSDVVDVVRAVYVAFYGQSGATYFTNPCE